MLEYYHDVRRFYYFFTNFATSSTLLNLLKTQSQCLTLLLRGQVLGHQVSDEHLPDVNLIGEMGDVTELGKLVQLVLGCAVSCEKKQGKLGAVKEN